MVLGTLIFIFGMFSLSCANSPDPNDLALLKSLMQSIIGFPSDWDTNITTNTTTNITNICSWSGITCIVTNNSTNPIHRLSGISLPNSKLTGKLPQSGWIASKYLTIVKFSSNFLSGLMPPELLSISKGEIYLDNNDFEGTLPNIITKYGSSSLFKLHIHNNKFQGCVPSSWATMNSLCNSKPLDCPRLNLEKNYLNCSDADCMKYLPKNSKSFCPLPFLICQEGHYCWNIPPTILFMVGLMCGGFLIGTLAMFVAAKYVDMGSYSPLPQEEREITNKIRTTRRA